jgi:site-specific DNA-methyltransferase (adenine-specific)
MTFTDKLEEFSRAKDIVMVDCFADQAKAPSDKELAQEMERRGILFVQNNENTIRVMLSTSKMLPDYKPAWDLIQDVANNEDFMNVFNTDTFNHGVKELFTKEKTTNYWFTKKVLCYYDENNENPDKNQLSDISESLFLAINMAYNFVREVQEIPGVGNAVELLKPILSDLLAKNYYDDSLKQEVATTNLLPVFDTIISALQKNPKENLLKYVLKKTKSYYDNSVANYPIIEDMKLQIYRNLQMPKQMKIKLNKRKNKEEKEEEDNEEVVGPKKKSKKSIDTSNVVHSDELISNVGNEFEVESHSVENSNISTPNVQIEEMRKQAAEELAQQEETFKQMIRFEHTTANEFIKIIPEFRNKVDLLCLDPPYDVLNIERDMFSPEDMKDTVDAAYHLLRPKGIVIIFCAWQKAQTWSNLLKEDSKFTVFSSALHIVKSPKTGYWQQGASNMQSMVEMAVVAYKKGVSEGALTFNYIGNQTFIQGSFNRGMNVIENYIRPSERLRIGKKILRTEEKSTDLYLEIFARFANKGDTVVDLFAGTASSAFAALRYGLSWIGCEKEKMVYDAAFKRLRSRFDLLYSKKQLQTLGITKSMNLPKLLAAENRGIPKSNFPIDVGVLLCSGSSTDAILFDQLEKLKLDVKPISLGGFEEQEGLFTKKRIEKGETICTYWGKILNENERNQLIKDNELSDRCVEFPKKYNSKSYWIDADLGCPAVYINCCIDMKKKKLFEPNAELIFNALENVQSLSDHDCIEVVAVKDIEIGEEIFIQYIKSNNYQEVEDWFKLGSNAGYIDAVLLSTIEMIGQNELIDTTTLDEDSGIISTGTGISTGSFNVEDYDIMAIQFLEDIKKTDLAMYKIGDMLWGRYQKLDILDCKKHANLALESLKMIQNTNSKVMDIVIQILNNQPNDTISYWNQHYQLLKNVVEDNVENRNFSKSLVDFGKRAQHQTLNDQNYEQSSGRKIYVMETDKEIAKMKELDFFDEVIKICWPAYSPGYHTLIWSTEKTARQGFHTDYNQFGGEFKHMSYLSILSLGDDNYIWFGKSGLENVYEKIYAPFGSMFIFSGNCIHAGPEFTGSSNMRVFQYIESPTMIHKDKVSQDFLTYSNLTVQLNNYK